MSMFSEKAKKDITKYYTKTFFDYFVLLRLWEHWGMHYGFYNTTHHTLKDAILNMNKVLAEKAGIKRGMNILDAGCGVGGSSIWLAQNIGTHVTGITIVDQQYHKANELAKKYHVEDKTEFLIRDFRETGFPSQSFDIVWAIESVCYAEDKRDFLREAKRILKPGGRVVVADGFMKKEILTHDEKQYMERWLRGWAVPNLASISGFTTSMQELGFQHVRHEDVTANVLPFSRWLYHRGLIVYPATKILEWLKLRSKVGTENVVAAVWQYRTLIRKIWAYAIFTAAKPLK